MPLWSVKGLCSSAHGHHRGDPIGERRGDKPIIMWKKRSGWRMAPGVQFAVGGSVVARLLGGGEPGFLGVRRGVYRGSQSHTPGRPGIEQCAHDHAQSHPSPEVSVHPGWMAGAGRMS